MQIKGQTVNRTPALALRSSGWFSRGQLCHLVLAVVIVSQSLAILVQLAHQHLPRAEIKRAEVHLVTKVTGQLRLAPKLLPRWTNEEDAEMRRGKKKKNTTLALPLSKKQRSHRDWKHERQKTHRDDTEKCNTQTTTCNKSTATKRSRRHPNERMSTLWNGCRLHLGSVTYQQAAHVSGKMGTYEIYILNMCNYTPPSSISDHNVNMAKLKLVKCFRVETLELRCWGEQQHHLEPERWPNKGTTVGGYVLE